jgi:hypothetical protein
MTAANIYPPMSGSRQAAQPQWAQLFASGVPRAAESAPRTLHLQIAWGDAPTWHGMSAAPTTADCCHSGYYFYAGWELKVT